MESEEIPVRRCEDKRGPGGIDQVREVRTDIYFKVRSGPIHKVWLVRRSPYFTQLEDDTEFLDNVKSIGHC